MSINCTVPSQTNNVPLSASLINDECSADTIYVICSAGNMAAVFPTTIVYFARWSWSLSCCSLALRPGLQVLVAAAAILRYSRCPLCPGLLWLLCFGSTITPKITRNETGTDARECSKHLLLLSYNTI